MSTKPAYYPFGLKHNAYVPARKDVKYQEQLVEKKEIKQITPEEGKYRYGFQGQEMDNEVKGVGNSLNYKYRMHDPRLGRFFAVDPLFRKYPELTPYQFSSNNPIGMLELEGLEGTPATQKKTAKLLIKTVKNMGRKFAINSFNATHHIKFTHNYDAVYVGDIENDVNFKGLININRNKIKS